MRLGGQSKAGFYPTPPQTLELIASCLTSYRGAALLDPCCGEGVALARLGEELSAQTYGIELSKARAEEARGRLGVVLHGNALTARHEAETSKVGLLYLNPPFDSGDGERLEARFLYHFKDMVEPGGVLVFVATETYMDTWARTLTPYFENLRAFRFPEAECERFRQIVIFGTRRSSTGLMGRLGALETLTRNCCRFQVPVTREPYIYIAERDPQELYALAGNAPLWGELWESLGDEDRAPFRPLLPLRKGHLALLISAGLLNGCVVEAGGRRLLVKGSVTKGATVKLETLGEGSARRMRRTERDVFRTKIRALDLATGELICIGETQDAQETQAPEESVERAEAA